MKINGQSALPPPTIVVPIARFDNGVEKVIPIRLTAVSDFSEFEQLVETPKPRVKYYPDGKEEPFLDDPLFKDRMVQYYQLQTHWAFWKGFRDNPSFHWDAVVASDPTTWKNVELELREWLLPTEMAVLLNEWMKLSGMDLDRIRGLRERFLSGAVPELTFLPTFQEGEQSSTVSSEPAKDVGYVLREPEPTGTTVP